MDSIMDHSKWLRRFVYCRGAYIAVYQYYSFNYEMNKEADVKPQVVNSSSKDVVLLLAGCANSVAIYTMLGDRSLPDYLYNNGYDVWAMDLRGHGESEPPSESVDWDMGTYAFLDTATVVDYVYHQTDGANLHIIGHSMGGMIAMALLSHFEFHKKISSIIALGSSIYLANSICRLFDPFLPTLRIIGGVDLPLWTDLMGKVWKSCGNEDPTCGNGGNGSCSAEDVMASHLNSGSKRTYSFMERMFFYEPVGVFEDFSVGLKDSGLILKLRDRPKQVREEVQVTVKLSSSEDHASSDCDGRSNSSNASPDPDGIQSERGGDINNYKDKDKDKDKDNYIVSVDGILTYENQFETLELQNFIGKYNQRIMLLNGTEDNLVVVADVQKSYETICNNAKSVFEETGVEPKGGKPTIYTAGTQVGGAFPYSHFDLVFGEDAPTTIFPAILSFLDGSCEGRYEIL